ncbi:MAG: hypothetical protein Q7T04_04170, partial [Dehalococcoidia bacterium]|nr:hypothetical protein [Dehalococcoidia bacterium]
SNVADISVVYTTITMWDNASITANFAPILAGDENVDGVVNLVDLVRVAAAFGSAPGLLYWNPMADLDRNGVVDIFDLVTVGVNYGRSAG